jgi:methionyl-tRNA formyltransferase
MGIDEGLDTGPVYRREEVAIGAEETAAQLRGRLADLGAAMLIDALRDGLGPARPQEGEATYATKLEPDELHLNWSRAALELQRVIRIGRAWTTWRGKRLLVLSARLLAGDVPGAPGSLEGDAVVTGDGRLQLLIVQPEGRAALPAPEWLRGARPRPGELLGT